MRIAQKYDISEDIVLFNRQNFELEVGMVDLSSQSDAEVTDLLPRDAAGSESRDSSSELDINFVGRGLRDISSTDAVIEMEVEVLTRPTEQGEMNGIK